MVVSTPTVKQRILLAMTTVMAFATSTGLLIAAFWVWGPDPQYFQVAQEPMHSAQFKDGDIVVFRASKVVKPIQLHITRNLVRVNGAQPFGLAMPDFDLYVEEGEHAIYRKIDVPYTLMPGEYELRSTATWRANPLRNVSTKLPVVRFTVPG